MTPARLLVLAAAAPALLLLTGCGRGEETGDCNAALSYAGTRFEIDSDLGTDLPGADGAPTATVDVVGCRGDEEVLGTTEVAVLPGADPALALVGSGEYAGVYRNTGVPRADVHEDLGRPAPAG